MAAVAASMDSNLTYPKLIKKLACYFNSRFCGGCITNGSDGDL
jgi:hypothetical protein